MPEDPKGHPLILEHSPTSIQKLLHLLPERTIIVAGNKGFGRNIRQMKVKGAIGNGLVLVQQKNERVNIRTYSRRKKGKNTRRKAATLRAVEYSIFDMNIHGVDGILWTEAYGHDMSRWPPIVIAVRYIGSMHRLKSLLNSARRGNGVVNPSLIDMSILDFITIIGNTRRILGDEYKQRLLYTARRCRETGCDRVDTIGDDISPSLLHNKRIVRKLAPNKKVLSWLDILRF